MDKELKEKIDDINLKYQWEFDTPEMREQLNKEVKSIINQHIKEKRDKKLKDLLS